MTIILNDEVNFFKEHEDLYRKVEAVLEKGLELEKVPYEVEISLSVVDMPTIQEMNKEHRNIDKPTDVLSFPQIEPIQIGVIDWEKLDFSSCVNYDSEEIILGDIVLCSEQALLQAQTYQHSLEREICFLVAHSLLHLLGYDHIFPEDEKIMFAKQEVILYDLGINR